MRLILFFPLLFQALAHSSAPLIDNIRCHKELSAIPPEGEIQTHYQAMVVKVRYDCAGASGVRIDLSLFSPDAKKSQIPLTSASVNTNRPQGVEDLHLWYMASPGSEWKLKASVFCADRPSPVTEKSFQCP